MSNSKNKGAEEQNPYMSLEKNFSRKLKVHKNRGGQSCLVKIQILQTKVKMLTI